MLAQPKLQSCVPFTPVTGARILVRHADMRAALTTAAAQTLTKITGAHFRSRFRHCMPSHLRPHTVVVVVGGVDTILHTPQLY